MSTSTYELKYLKYKNKYLNLKKLLNDQSGSGGDQCFDTWAYEQYQKGPANAKCGGLLSSCKEFKILGDLHLCMSTSHPVIKQMVTIYPTFLKITDFNWTVRKHFLRELINNEFSFETIFRMGFYYKEVSDLVNNENKQKAINIYAKNTNYKLYIIRHNEFLRKQKSKDATKPFTYKQLVQMGFTREIFYHHSQNQIIFNKEEVTINDFLASSYCKNDGQERCEFTNKRAFGMTFVDKHCYKIPYNCSANQFLSLGYTLEECFASNLPIDAYSNLDDLKQLLKKFTMKEILSLDFDWNENNLVKSFTINELLEGIETVDKKISIKLLEKIVYNPFYGENEINVNGLNITEGFKKVIDEIKSLKSAEERLNIYVDLYSKFKKLHDIIFAAKVFEIDNKLFLNKLDTQFLNEILNSPHYKQYFYNDTTKEIFINRLTPIEIINANILSFGEAVKNLVDTKKIELGDVIDNWKGDQITYKVLKDAGFDKEKLLMANLKPTWIARMGF